MTGFGVAIALWAAFWTWAFFPGESSIDTLLQYRQGLSGEYSNAHPTLYSMALGRSGDLVGDGSLVLLAQTGVGALALGWIAWSLRSAGTAAKAAFVLLAFNPLMWAQWTTLWKDEPLAICTLAAFAVCLNGWARWCIPLLVAATCFRHNGITLVFPIALWLGWHESRTSGRTAGALLGSLLVLLCLISPKLLDVSVGATDGRAAAPTLVFDIAGAYVREPRFRKAGPFQDVVMKQIKHRHRGHTARYLVAGGRRGVPGLRHSDFDEARYALLKEEWVRLVTTRPDLWLRHRAEFACNLLNVCMPYPMEPHGRTDARIGAQVGWVDPEGLAYRILDPLRSVFGLLALGWVWLVPVLIAGGLALRRRRELEVAIAGSGLAYLVGNMLLAPSAPFRYHLPMMMAAVVLVPLAIEPHRPQGNAKP